MPLVLGVDSSTQSTKAVLVDADDGTVVAQRSAPHPPGTEVDPTAWLGAVETAGAGLLERASAVAVSGQQHGMVALDAAGRPVRDALLWNDTRSARAAQQLIAELGGAQACADAIGSVLVASFTSTKLRWLRDHEPENAARVAQVLLPHDYVSAHLAEPGTPTFTDRGDASGTGYFDARTATWRRDLMRAALGHDADLPAVAASGSVAGTTRAGAVLAPGTGDNMGAALGLDLTPATSSSRSARRASRRRSLPTRSPTGPAPSPASPMPRGGFLPMVTTMNAAGILDLQARWLGVDHDELGRARARIGTGRQRGDAVALLRRRAHAQPARRASAPGPASPPPRPAPTSRGPPSKRCCAHWPTRSTPSSAVPAPSPAGCCSSEAQPAAPPYAPSLRRSSAAMSSSLEEGEYVARGAARQAAWALSGADRATRLATADRGTAHRRPDPSVRERYAALRDRLDPNATE